MGWQGLVAEHTNNECIHVLHISKLVWLQSTHRLYNYIYYIILYVLYNCNCWVPHSLHKVFCVKCTHNTMLEFCRGSLPHEDVTKDLETCKNPMH